MTDTPQGWNELSDGWARSLREEGVVGGSLWFARGDEVLAQAHEGLADRASGRAVDADTIYHWASVTKIFTGIAVLQLRDRGLLDLDQMAIEILPEIRVMHGAVGAMTIRHLLSHRAGLRTQTFPWGGDEPWHPMEPKSWSQVEATYPYTRIEFEPGSKYQYSNIGTSLLGRVIETLSGEDYDVYMDKNVLRPLGLLRAYFDRDPPYLLGYKSNNYQLQKDGPAKENGFLVDTGATVANGGLNAPLGDMMAFGRFLLGIGDAARFDVVLNRASLEEMMGPVTETGDGEEGTREQMGLSIFLIDDLRNDAANPRRFAGHTGGQAGFRTFFYVEPRSRATLVCAMNTRPAENPRKILYAARRRLFDFVDGRWP